MRKSSIVRSARVVRALKIVALLGTAAGLLLLLNLVLDIAGFEVSRTVHQAAERMTTRGL